MKHWSNKREIEKPTPTMTDQAWKGINSVDADDDDDNNTCILVQLIKKHILSVGPISGYLTVA